VDNKRKKFGKKVLVEWVFSWEAGGKVARKVGDLVCVGDVLFKEEDFLSPIDGKVLRIDNEKKELILGFKAFEFVGESEGEVRVWAEVVVENGEDLEIEEVEEKIVVFSKNCPILMAKLFALGAKGVIVFADDDEISFPSPFLKLSKEEKEKFLSVLKLMERPVVHLDSKKGRLLLTENKKIR